MLTIASFLSEQDARLATSFLSVANIPASLNHYSHSQSRAVYCVQTETLSSEKARDELRDKRTQPHTLPSSIQCPQCGSYWVDYAYGCLTKPSPEAASTNRLAADEFFCNKCSSTWK